MTAATTAACIFALMVAAAAAADGGARCARLPLDRVADVPLPGDTSRFDYASYDAGRHLLFIAHLGASEVLAFDTRTASVIGRIPELGHVHGVLAVPELNRVYASATRTDEVVAIDETTLKTVARIPGGFYPDGMAYVPEMRKLYVSDEAGETETVIDAVSNRRLATIPLGGEAGNTQYDPGSGHIFVNVQSRRQLVEIDPATDRIVARDDLPGARGNHGLLIEPQRRLAFIACEDNDKLLVFDLRTRQVRKAFDLGREPDVLAYDAGLGLLYVASESGSVSLFGLDAAELRPLGQDRLAPDAHVVAVAPDDHRAYFPLKDIDGHPALRITRPCAGPAS